MTPSEVTNILRKFNAWRRGDEDSPQFDRREIGKAIDAAVEMLERADLVEKALAELIADLEVRARWDREATQGIVACGATVYRNAKAALEKSK
jgi:hypothetical protein